MHGFTTCNRHALHASSPLALPWPTKILGIPVVRSSLPAATYWCSGPQSGAHYGRGCSQAGRVSWRRYGCLQVGAGCRAGRKHHCSHQLPSYPGSDPDTCSKGRWILMPGIAPLSSRSCTSNRCTNCRVSRSNLVRHPGSKARGRALE